jgi:biopolymer transport protein ExbD
VIDVYRDGRLALDREEVTLEQLVERLSGEGRGGRELGVLVRGDAAGAFQNVATVLGACRKAGISEMGISVRIAERTP